MYCKDCNTATEFFSAIGQDMNYVENSAASAKEFAQNQRIIQLAMAAPQIEIARIQSAPAYLQSQTNAQTQPIDASSLSRLRAAQGDSTFLRARTQNLKTTADVSQQVQKPVQAEAIRALPYLIGGTVALGLLILILNRTRKK